MRILYVITDSDMGGAERLLQNLAEAKDPADHLGLIVLMKEGTISEDLKNSFDQVLHLGFDYSSRNILGMIRRFTKAAKAFKPDVITSHLFHADLVVALAPIKVPKITTMHTQKLGEGVHPLTKIIARTVGILSKRFAAVVPTSSAAEMKEFLKEYRYKNVVEAIPNVTRVPESCKYDLTNKTFTSIGRNHPVKGHKMLLKSFGAFAKEFDDWHLELYGPGVEQSEEAMQNAIVEAGVTNLVEAGAIKLLGPVNDVAAPLANSSALVISSLYGETFPLVGVESAAHGVPVITSNVGSCFEFVDDDRFLFTPGSVEELTESLKLFAKLPSSVKQELSTKARTRAVDKYGAKNAYRAYKELFESLVSKNQ